MNPQSIVPLSEIPPTQTTPTCGRMVLVKYQFGDRVDEIPANLIRVITNTDEGHPQITVNAHGDGPINCPFRGVETLSLLTLLDPLDGRVPEVGTFGTGPFAGMRVWAEWMPWQHQQRQIRQQAPSNN